MYNNKNKKDYFRNRDFANPNFFNSNNNNHESGDRRQGGKDRSSAGLAQATVSSYSHSHSPANASMVYGGADNGASSYNNTYSSVAQPMQLLNSAMNYQQSSIPTATITSGAIVDSSANSTENEHTEDPDLEIAPHLHKHPLQNTWTLWYLENDRTKTWEDMQNEITSFDTVEDFWSLYNHIKTPSELKIGCDYSLFKKDIRPMWEDTANKQGGRWVITMNKNCKEDLDNIWLDVMLCLIGETFVNNEEVCGAVVNIRSKSNKISIWTANGNNKDAALEIGYKLRDTLHLRPQNLQYQLHKDTMVKQGSVVKSVYVL